jgi:hypothetical protein
LLVNAAVVVGRGCNLLTALLAPLLTASGALLNILYDDVGQRFPAGSWGWVNLGRIVADDVLGDDAA